jgi:hypothetical protein
MLQSKATITFHNEDKDIILPENLGDDLSNFPRGSRIILAGLPNSGKSHDIKTIIFNAKPRYERVIVIVADINTKEYDLTNEVYTSVLDIPNLVDIYEKTLLVFDDVDFIALKKEEKILIDSLFKFYASHYGLTCIIACQNYFSSPVSLRRKINIFILHRTSNMIIKRVFSELGVINPKKANAFIKKYLSEKHDSITVYPEHDIPLRHNLIYPIILNGEDDI